MRYRQNTKGDILYGPPVIVIFQVFQKVMMQFHRYSRTSGDRSPTKFL